MKLSELITAVQVIESAHGDPDVLALAYDSRDVRPGSLFVAVSGERADGHDFVDQALALGAAAVVLERARPGLGVPQVIVKDSRAALASLANKFYDYPSGKLRLIGITGTNGKTTTAYIVESILRGAGYRTGLIGTIEYRINGEILKAERTTPEAPDLQQMLASMVNEGVDAVVMEVSSHALALGRVAGCEFAARVFTNLSQDHLDYHQDIEAYFNVKSRLFMEPEFGDGVSVVNSDDEFGRRLSAMSPSRDFGTGAKDYRVHTVEQDISGTSFSLDSQFGSMRIKSTLLGDFNVSNCAAAVATCLELGVDPQTVIKALAVVPVVPGRFESVDCMLEFRVIVDYAHTPDGLEKVLTSALELIDGGRLITVFGCGGDRDKGKRPKMGNIAATLSDLAIVTSDNPRGEEPGDIIEDILAGLGARELNNTQVIVDREEAIRTAISEARAGDIVMIAGKGHENYQIVNEKVVPFDDRLVAKKALMELCR